MVSLCRSRFKEQLLVFSRDELFLAGFWNFQHIVQDKGNLSTLHYGDSGTCGKDDDGARDTT